MFYENGKARGLKVAYIGGGSRGWAWMLMNDLKKVDDMSGDVYLYDIDYTAAKNNENIKATMVYYRENKKDKSIEYYIEED